MAPVAQCRDAWPLWLAVSLDTAWASCVSKGTLGHHTRNHVSLHVYWLLPVTPGHCDGGRGGASLGPWGVFGFSTGRETRGDLIYCHAVEEA